MYCVGFHVFCIPLNGYYAEYSFVQAFTPYFLRLYSLLCRIKRINLHNYAVPPPNYAQKYSLANSFSGLKRPIPRLYVDTLYMYRRKSCPKKNIEKIKKVENVRKTEKNIAIRKQNHKKRAKIAENGRCALLEAMVYCTCERGFRPKTNQKEKNKWKTN